MQGERTDHSERDDRECSGTTELPCGPTGGSPCIDATRGRTLIILMAAPFGAGKSPGDDFAARSEYVEVVRPLPHHGMPLLVELGNPIARLAQGKHLSQDAG